MVLLLGSSRQVLVGGTGKRKKKNEPSSHFSERAAGGSDAGVQDLRFHTFPQQFFNIQIIGSIKHYILQVHPLWFELYAARLPIIVLFCTVFTAMQTK